MFDILTDASDGYTDLLNDCSNSMTEFIERVGTGTGMVPQPRFHRFIYVTRIYAPANETTMHTCQKSTSRSKGEGFRTKQQVEATPPWMKLPHRGETMLESQQVGAREKERV